jgi:hypothetical protein
MRKVIISSRILTILIIRLLVVFLQNPVIVYAEDGMEHNGMIKSKTVYFPQFQPFQTVKNEAYLLYGIVGKLILRDECLRVVSKNREYLLIWPSWYEFGIAGRDIVVTHLHTSSVIAQLKMGDTVSFSGAELENNPIALQYAIPDHCEGPYWAVGDIESVKTENPIKYYKNQENKEPAKSTKKFNKPIKKNYTSKKTGKETQKTNKELRKLEIKIEDSILR